MADKIEKIDMQEGTTMAWHNKTIVKSLIELASCWLAQWDVRKRPLIRQFSDGSQEQSETCEMVCSDNERIIVGKPVNCETYGMISNREFLAIVGEAMLGIKGAKVASVGSICNRGKVFVSIQLEELKTLTAAGRVFEPFLNFGNGFDFTTFYANTSRICTVCANTDAANLTIARDGSKTAVRAEIRHTKNAVAKLQNVPDMVDGFLGANAEFVAIMGNLANEKMTEVTARPFFAGLLANGKKEEISTRRFNQVERLTELFQTGKGNRGQDRSDAYQAVTDYATHESAGNVDAWRQVASSEFGSGNRLKEFAFETLQDSAKVREFATIGEANLATAD